MKHSGKLGGVNAFGKAPEHIGPACCNLRLSNQFRVQCDESIETRLSGVVRHPGFEPNLDDSLRSMGKQIEGVQQNLGARANFNYGVSKQVVYRSLNLILTHLSLD